MPAQFLARDSGLFVSRGGPSLGLLLFLVGAVRLVAALARPMALLSLPAGIGAVGIAAWYVIRLRSYTGSTFRDLVGVGAFLAIVGGLVTILGRILTLVRR